MKLANGHLERKVYMDGVLADLLTGLDNIFPGQRMYVARGGIRQLYRITGISADEVYLTSERRPLVVEFRS